MQQGNNDSLKSKTLIGEEDCQHDYEFLDAEPSDVGFDIFYKCKHCNHNAAVTQYTNEIGPAMFRLKPLIKEKYELITSKLVQKVSETTAATTTKIIRHFLAILPKPSTGYVANES
jgi:hypothetical protein